MSYESLCRYCSGQNWLIRSEIIKDRHHPFVFPCPYCNPNQSKPPIVVDRKAIDRLIDKNKENQ